MKNITITILSIAIIAAGIVILSQRETKVNLGAGPISPAPTMASNSSTTVGSVNVATIVLGDPSRRVLALSNNGGIDCWVSATSTKLTPNSGAILKASSTEWFFGDSLYTGTLYGICNASTVISYFEL